MKQTLTKLAALTLTLAMTISLAGCGGDKDAASQPETTPGNDLVVVPDLVPDVIPGETPSASPAGSPAQPQIREITLSQHLSSGQTIWFYYTSSYAGKDTKVKTIFVMDSDGSLYSSGAGGATLGQLEQMEDANIVAMVKEGHAENGLGRYDEVMDLPPLLALLEICHGDPGVFLREAVYTYMSEGTAALKSFELPQNDTFLALLDDLSIRAQENPDTLFLLEEFFCFSSVLEAQSLNECLVAIEAEFNPEYILVLQDLVSVAFNHMEKFQEELRNYEAPAGQYKLSIISDHTGNKTANLALNCRIDTLEGTDIESYTLYYMYPAGNMISNCDNEIYDSTFGGYGTQNGAFLTRMSNDCSFVLDQIGESSLPIDVEPEDLFQ